MQQEYLPITTPDFKQVTNVSIVSFRTVEIRLPDIAK